MSIRLGSEYIESTNRANNTEDIDVIFDVSESSSPDKLYVGGMPLTLANYNSTKKILRVVVASSSTYNNDSTVLDGFTLAVKRRGGSEGQYVLAVNEVPDSVGTVKETIFAGQPLAISENNQLLVEEVAGTISEYVNFAFGSLILEAALIDSNYYLVVSE